jgi:hypothetical protein
MNKNQDMEDNSLFNNCNIEITQDDVLKIF